MKNHTIVLVALAVLVLDYLVAKRHSADMAGYNAFRGLSGDLTASGFLGIRYPFI